MKTSSIFPCTAILAGLILMVACGSNANESVVAALDSDGTKDLASNKPTLDVADFTLTDTDGKQHTLSDYVAAGDTVVLEWFNPDCPFVKKYHEGDASMVEVYDDVKSGNLVWLAINSGAEGKQGAGLDRNKKAIADWGIPYPILLDMDGKVGRAYGAATTPHMFVISPKGELLYEGAIDDSKGRGESKTNYVAKTLKEYRAGKPITVSKTKSFGCSVKYAK
ncbi:MAG: redoxin domain-containing protein [Planctomycetota bacterium]|jgi:peroxiredoxin|nr:redoxin domain-containing protein [Planctomycetota bacterium]